MSFNPLLAERVRKALIGAGTIKERHMFGSLAFMVDGRLVLSVRNNDVIYKLGRERSAQLITQGIAVPAKMGLRTMKAWVEVPDERLSNPSLFDELLAEAVKEEL